MPTNKEIFDFSIKVEQTVVDHGMTHLEAILYLCEQTGLEIEVAARLVSVSLKEKLAANAEDMNLMKSKHFPKLPI
jgi:hypothetical protein